MNNKKIVDILYKVIKGEKAGEREEAARQICQLEPEADGEILGKVEILGDGTRLDLRTINRNLGTMPKPDEGKLTVCAFQNGTYPCGSTKNPDCELCHKVVSIMDAKFANEKAKFGLSVHEAAVKQCQAECRRKVERIFKRLESFKWTTGRAVTLKDSTIVIDAEDLQALKKREGI